MSIKRGKMKKILKKVLTDAFSSAIIVKRFWEGKRLNGKRKAAKNFFEKN